METAILDFIIQGGSWFIGVLAASFIGRQFISYIMKDKEQDREDAKADKEIMYKLIEKQNKISEEQKDMLVRTGVMIEQQIEMEKHNREMLNGLRMTMDKMNDIQMLHTHRLDRIEDKQEQLEQEIKKIGDKL